MILTVGFYSVNFRIVLNCLEFVVFMVLPQPCTRHFSGWPSFRDSSLDTNCSCWDFNSVFDRALDHFGSDPSDLSWESSASLLSLFYSCCVIDMWRYLHPNDSGFTWTRWNGALASRIDLFGVPYVRVPSVSCCDIVPCPFSDHCAVFLSVVVSDVVPPGPGLWKLNTSTCLLKLLCRGPLETKLPEITCQNCHEKGHLAFNCPSRTTSQENNTAETSTSNEQDNQPENLDPASERQ